MSFNPLNYTYDWSAIAAFIAAFLLLISTFYTLRRSAKIEFAKFRMEWIGKLREDLSEFQSMAMQPNSQPHEKARFYELGTRIELRLNPKTNTSHEELIDQMYEMLGVSSGTLSEKYATNPKFIKLSQSILKQEWEATKKDVHGIFYAKNK